MVKQGANRSGKCLLIPPCVYLCKIHFLISRFKACSLPVLEKVSDRRLKSFKWS